jgi:DNA repair exonuclease SbcCD nuclease subunit
MEEFLHKIKDKKSINGKLFRHKDKIGLILQYISAKDSTEYDEIEKCDALMGHFEIQTFKMNTYKLCEHGFTGKMLGKKSPLIFSGHFHLRDERDYGSYKINYVGNPFEMDFGDSESSKGYYIIDFDSMEYEFFENKISPKHKKIKLSQFDNSKNIIGNNIVKIIVDTNIENDELEKYSTNIQQLNPISLSFDNTAAFNPILEELDDEYDLSGVDMEKAITDFVALLDIEDKDSVSSYTINLYKNV